MRYFSLFFLLVCNFVYTYADPPTVIKKQLNWEAEPIIHSPTGNFALEIYSFEGALYNESHPSLPYYSERFPLSSPGQLRYQLVNARYEALDKKPSEDDRYIGEEPIINLVVEKDNRKHFGKLFFIPIRKVGNNRYEKLVEFEIRILHSPTAPSTVVSQRNTTTSVLNDGDIYKIAIKEEGLHRLSYSFLKDELKIDIDNIDPRTIKIYGNGGGMLPEANAAFRYDDLEENAIQISGEDDGSFDSNDYILFYAGGPHKWEYVEDKSLFRRQTNVYSDEYYYFIKISSGNGLRVGNQPSMGSTAYTTNSFNDFIRHEEERFNLLSEAIGNQGSGQDWFGDQFNTTRERTYNEFSFPNLINNEPVLIELSLAVRANRTSTYTVDADGTQLSRLGITSVNVGNIESLYAKSAFMSDEFLPNSDNPSITIRYPAVGDATNAAWLDFIELNARRQLRYTGEVMNFRDIKTTAYTSTTFELDDATANLSIWDITDPTKPRRQEATLSNSRLSFGVPTVELKTFVVFNEQDNLLSPTAVGQINNQNVHGTSNIDMAIIYHPDFEEAAKRLADHRSSHSNMNVATVNLEELINEFGSGVKDPTAIRDFAKLMYERSPNFHFLLLFGDASFDYRDINSDGPNLMPTYETSQSLHPIESFPTDDYFALLDDIEGDDLIGALDIAVGRIPARSPTEANIVVNKIINYDSDSGSMRDWRNRLIFVADDEDGNRHINDADGIAEDVGGRHPVFNINKVYLDAYQQESTPGGDRIPKAQEAINRDIFRGVLVFNYLGHGGAKGLAQERVLTNADIDNWNNNEKLPLFVTATCSFTGYDEPTITSAGEQAVLRDNGGVIGLFTTVRAVYANSNERLTSEVFDNIFPALGQEPMTIGEIMRISKNANRADTSGTNARKFTLIGDPAMKLAVPRYTVATTFINEHDVSDGQSDTIRALQRVTVKGLIKDDAGNTMTDFNGRIYPTVYDKEIEITTLGQDERSEQRNFDIQKNVLFKGTASVINGAFEFTFVVPKDINYQFGNGKISYYAEDGEDRDARGLYSNVIIGDTYENAIVDDQGPLVEVFMNRTDFVFGGTTNKNPTLLVKLSDDNGINVVGNSIGHDLTGVLDENTQNTYVLNDFYEAELDDYTKGTVRFPLFDLQEGLHNIKVRAWDTANNQAEGYTEFVVAESGEMALKFVLNYPNPFTTNTSFQFEHNQADQIMDIQVQIFTVSGRLVKTIVAQASSQGGRVSGINWDGRDDYGDRLARGVYVYRIKSNTSSERGGIQRSESGFEKLVILK
ncbi:MAG: type IX secretion system sortase PorU [Bacteroidota bacterium]